jgi:hypothetical protein
MIGINIPERTYAPLEAFVAAAAEAQRVAGGDAYHSIGAARFDQRQADGTLADWLIGCRALIIGVSDGYVIHAVDPSDGAILSIQARIWVQR